jgi:hypothetical protein
MFTSEFGDERCEYPFPKKQRQLLSRFRPTSMGFSELLSGKSHPIIQRNRKVKYLQQRRKLLMTNNATSQNQSIIRKQPAFQGVEEERVVWNAKSNSQKCKS